MEQPNEDQPNKYSLESLINDPTFEKEAPELFKQFLEELKMREPELYQKMFDGLGLFFGIDREVGYEFVQNRQIPPPLNVTGLVNRAYANLKKRTADTLRINVVVDGMGMLMGGNTMESSFVMLNNPKYPKKLSPRIYRKKEGNNVIEIVK